MSAPSEEKAAQTAASEEVKRRYAHYHEAIWREQFESPYRIRRYIHRRRYEALLRHIPPGSRLLDAGCGEGVLCYLAAQRGAHCTAFDIGMANLTFAAEKLAALGFAERVSLLQADLEEIPFRDKSFDLVVASQVLEHIPDLDRGLAELRRVTRERLLIGVPTCLSPASWVILGEDKPWRLSRRSPYAMLLGLFRTLRCLGQEGVPEHYGTGEDLPHLWFFPWPFERRLRRAGFRIVGREAASLCLPYLGQVFPPAMALMRLLDHLKRFRPFCWLGYGMAYVLELDTPPPPSVVAHLVQSLAPGGRRRVIHELARSAQESGIPTMVVSLGPKDEDASGCPVPVRRLTRPRRFSWRLVRELARLFRRAGVRLVHAHDGASHLYAVAAAGLIPGCRVVMTFHRSRDDADSGSRRARLRNRLCTLASARVVAVSQARAVDFRRLHRVPAGRVTFIHNGARPVDPLPEDAPLPPGWPRSPGPRIGMVAHLGPEKGHEVLFAALATQGMPRLAKAHALLLGDGSSHRREALQGLARRLGIAERVHFLGHHPQAARLMHRFDLLVLPSLQEAYGLVLVEAMLARRPVVGSSVGGIPEIIEHERTGLLVPPGDARALARAIERLLEDEPLRRALAEAGRRRALERFTTQVQWERYRRLYTEVLGRDPAALVSAGGERAG
jgi:glycosyltransferase involved in cell wall biosynthesis